MTAEEEALLVARAGEQRVSVPRLLVEAALVPLSAQGETPTERRDAVALLFRAHRVLAGVANNVNQMAKATNATGEVAAEMRATLEAVRRTAERIDEATDALSGRPGRGASGGGRR